MEGFYDDIDKLAYHFASLFEYDYYFDEFAFYNLDGDIVIGFYNSPSRRSFEIESNLHDLNELEELSDLFIKSYKERL